ILFSNDAFGQHFAVEELYNDKANQCLLMKEALKYYVNILNPFSMLVAKKIDEIMGMGLNISMICPSHGVIWRDNPLQIIDKYAEWSKAYQEDRITVVYDTMWEGTARIAREISHELSLQHPDTVVKVFSVSKSDKNEVMTEVFKSKAIIVGSPTVSNDILSSMSGWLSFLKQLKFKNKKAAVFGCYGWSGEGNRILKERLKDAGFEVIEEEVKSLWNPEAEDFAKVKEMVAKI
ncbi:MAG TPA: MBL fold hydrolase, partial [Spirochaetaceae bacterium]|nr:MBL fold hydrolase [Spirochaetaceae bacterium]